MQITELDMDFIIREVSRRVNQNQATGSHDRVVQAVANAGSVNSAGNDTANLLGVFKSMPEAIDAADLAQKLYVSRFNIKDRSAIVAAIRKQCGEQVRELARMAHQETGLGRFEDKVLKNQLIIEKTPGPEFLSTEAISGDSGLTLVEAAPFGVIGAITPTTNPTSTIINNAISMISGGNAVCFNVHPSAKKCCAYTVHLINQAILSVAPDLKYLVTMVQEPSMETVKELTESPKIRLMVGTGGSAMVRSLLKSGKKTIGAGAGNPPVIVDDTADLKKAGQELFAGASFDNNVLCLAEKEVFVLQNVADDLIFQLIQAGAFMLNHEQARQIKELVLDKEEVPCQTGCTGNVRTVYHPSKKWVGKDAGLMLEQIGITGKRDVRLLIFEAQADDPMVLTEQLMPILPIVRCKDFNEAVSHALRAEHGNRHTASIFSKNVDHLTQFARAIETTIFVKNANTLAGVGFGGEGFTTMTIAGPTGEGLTNVRSFTRQRRCVLGDGGMRIL